MTSPLRIGTRGSRLALWQANYVAERLGTLAGARPIVLVEIQTAGDEVRDVPLPEIGGEGVFTKEIQRALLDDDVDVAVHSLKDLPTVPVRGLTLAAVPPRGPVGDVFVSHRHPSIAKLPAGAVLATGSLRRRAQLLYHRPDLQLVSIRGNVETRLRKMAEAGLDGLILAEAGLERLGLQEAISERLDLAWMLPAVGQGALGLECRQDDRASLDLVRNLDDRPSHQSVSAERALLQALGGGCQVPIGAVCTVLGDALTLRAAVLNPTGKQRIEGQITGLATQAEEWGNQLAQALLGRGAGSLLHD
jgi:hydroxymethylbilane synthase